MIGRRTGKHNFQNGGNLCGTELQFAVFARQNFHPFETNFGVTKLPFDGTVRIPNAGLVLAMMAGLQAVAPRAMLIFKFVDLHIDLNRAFHTNRTERRGTMVIQIEFRRA